jgi:hypothetical protein
MESCQLFSHSLYKSCQIFGQYGVKESRACLVGTQIYPTNFLAAYTILVLVWLVANILVAYGILPTLVTLPL